MLVAHFSYKKRVWLERWGGGFGVIASVGKPNLWSGFLFKTHTRSFEVCELDQQLIQSYGATVIFDHTRTVDSVQTCLLGHNQYSTGKRTLSGTNPTFSIS